jgi:hypothetical protein
MSMHKYVPVCLPYVGDWAEVSLGLLWFFHPLPATRLSLGTSLYGIGIPLGSVLVSRSPLNQRAIWRRTRANGSESLETQREDL